MRACSRARLAWRFAQHDGKTVTAKVGQSIVLTLRYKPSVGDSFPDAKGMSWPVRVPACALCDGLIACTGDDKEVVTLDKRGFQVNPNNQQPGMVGGSSRCVRRLDGPATWGA